jgi:peroxiredoxin
MTRDRLRKPAQTILRAGLSYVTLLLLMVSAGLNVLQAQRLRSFQQTSYAELQPGTPAPALDVRTLDGEPRKIAFGGRTTVLYYFSPQCGWCEKNWLNVKAFIASTNDRVRFVGLSTTPDIADFLAERRLNFEVYTDLSLEAARAYGFGGTPQTVVVSAEGVVERVWAGAYGERHQRDIETMFGVVLPGLPTPARPE